MGYVTFFIYIYIYIYISVLLYHCRSAPCFLNKQTKNNSKLNRLPFDFPMSMVNCQRSTNGYLKAARTS